MFTFINDIDLKNKINKQETSSLIEEMANSL